MRYLAAITMLILALAVVQPVEAQSFKPNYAAGEAAFGKGDYATALMHFRPLVAQGHAQAQFWMGWMYYNGKGVLKHYRQSAEWMRMSAKRGYAEAQYMLGTMYYDGKGVVQDLVMAYVWQNVATANGQLLANKVRDKIRAKLSDSERRLALKLSKLCFKNPAK